ncbi:MAG: hypothetical protein L0219_07385 [Phycisphaerales bacterium]|nr:hypothetical protein [Phycisphaerales bacterium]
MAVFDLYVEDVPEETVNALMLEYRVYRITQLYRCTRSQAVIEMQLDEILSPVDGWAVMLHFIFAGAEAKAKKHA